MTREWQPGDVGLNYGSRVFRTEAGWQFTDGEGIKGYEYTVTPLVVIDPEDREQIERFVRVYARQPNGPFVSDIADDIQEALREFADPKPPKPDEPTGLGAVVEDAEGKRYVRAADTDCTKPWAYANNYTDFDYDQIDAVKVLSEGVTP